ncbi:MAG: signal recognition particle protein [Burkholderiales bacterium]|nr:signal recognition particle protein [Burkholderiales bacterium]
MLESLTERLSRVAKTISGQARLTESNTKDMLREIRIALLEADVAIPVVRDLTSRIKEKALGEEVTGSLTPGQAFVGIVHKELTDIIGGSDDLKEREINLATQPPAVILLAGLQGSGKTTTAAKLARWLKKETNKKRILTVSTDVYRPAAIEQLKTVTEQAGADFFPSTAEEKPLRIATDALDYAKRNFYDVLIVDTAGRLAIDQQMMDEVSALEEKLSPIETFFVVDAMIGQDAVNTAKAFGERLPLTGIILTKLDGDSRGGAALSVRQITGKPIKFMGVGEKINGFQRFDPESMAGRILGMGDIVSLVEGVKEAVDLKKAQQLAKKIRKGSEFTLEDFKEQLAQMKNMSLKNFVENLPNALTQPLPEVDDEQAKKMVGRTIGIIDSMTPKERRKPEILKASRKRRVAAGAGVTVQDVNRLLKQFEQSREVMKMMKGGNLAKLMRAIKGMGGMGGGFPGMGGGFPGMGGFKH